MTGYKQEQQEDDDMSWQKYAICLKEKMNPDLFFSEGRGHSAKSPEAKEACGRCPVKDSCLDFALKHNIRDGVWGGTVYRERRELRRRSPYTGRKIPVRRKAS